MDTPFCDPILTGIFKDKLTSLGYSVGAYPVPIATSTTPAGCYGNFVLLVDLLSQQECDNHIYACMEVAISNLPAIPNYELRGASVFQFKDTHKDNKIHREWQIVVMIKNSTDVLEAPQETS